jgi:predicted RNase H-like HicB family nuclease
MDVQTYTFTAVVNWRGDEYYAFCLDVPATGVGETIEAAIAALKEDASGYLDEPLPSCVRFSILTLEVAASYRGEPVQTHSFTAVIWLHDRWFVAISPEVGTASQGKTFEHAIDMIKEATQLYLEEMPNPNYGHPQVINFELTTSALEVVRA